jgi:hypothetical protein
LEEFAEEEKGSFMREEKEKLEKERRMKGKENWV